MAPGGTVFGDALLFFERLGIFQVVLPFLLIFTLVFAILEKTKAFGMEKVGDHEYTRKNLNAMVAFVIAFLVVASTQVVHFITTFVLGVVILLLLAFFFLLLSGSFQKETKEGWFLEGRWKWTFMGIMMAGVLLVFLYSLPMPNQPGVSWLEFLYFSVAYNFDSTAVSSILLMIVVIGLIAFITWSPKQTEKKSE